MVSFSVTFLVYPGREGEVIRILLDHVEQAKKTRRHRDPVYRSRTDLCRYFIYHELTDQASYDAHCATKHYGTHILTHLYGMFDPDSLDMNTEGPLPSGEVPNP